MTESDRDFLRRTIPLLEQIRQDSKRHNCVVLASLLDLARAEAEDVLRTEAIREARIAYGRGQDADDVEAAISREFQRLRSE